MSSLQATDERAPSIFLNDIPLLRMSRTIS